MLKRGGGTTSFEVVLMQALEVLAMLNKFVTVLSGGGGGSQQVLDPKICHFIAPTSHN